MYTAKWITGQVLDASLADDWNRLVESAPTGTVFHRFEWLSEWWRMCGDGAELAVLMVSEGGRLVAIAPMYVPAGKRWRYLRLLGEGQSDYCDLVIDGDHLEPVWGFLLAEIKRFCRRESLHGLVALDVPSQHLEQRVQLQRMTSKRLGTTICPYCLLPGTWDEFLAGLGEKNRKEIPRYFRSLERKYGAVFGSSHRDPEAARQALEAFFDLHTRYWQSRGMPGMMPLHVREFHRRLAASLADALRLYEIRLDGQIRAVFYGFFYKGKMWAYLTGTDPEFKQARLGTAIFGHAIRMTIDEGGREFDFTRGDEVYKSQTWRAVTDRQNVDLVVPVTMRSKLGMYLVPDGEVPCFGPRTLLRILRSRARNRRPGAGAEEIPEDEPAGTAEPV